MYLLLKGKDLKVERMINEKGEEVFEFFLVDNVHLQVDENIKIDQEVVDNLLIFNAKKKKNGKDKAWVKL